MFPLFRCSLSRSPLSIVCTQNCWWSSDPPFQVTPPNDVLLATTLEMVIIRINLTIAKTQSAELTQLDNKTKQNKIYKFRIRFWFWKATILKCGNWIFPFSSFVLLFVIFESNNLLLSVSKSENKEHFKNIILDSFPLV